MPFPQAQEPLVSALRDVQNAKLHSLATMAPNLFVQSLLAKRAKTTQDTGEKLSLLKSSNDTSDTTSHNLCQNNIEMTQPPCQNH